MKSFFLIIFIICLIPSLVCADYVDKRLPTDTSVSIKDGARQLIQQGIGKRDVVKVTEKMLEDGFLENQVLSAFSILIKAKSQSLPEDPIMERLKEGIAKNVQAADILQAMEAVRFRYETANRYAEVISSDKDHVRAMTGEIAECFAAGIEDSDIGSVSGMLRQRSENTRQSKAEMLNKRTFRAMKTMARAGVESAIAFAVVGSALQSGFGPDEMEGLEDSFRLNANWASSVSDLAKSYAVAISNGVTFKPFDNYDQKPVGFGLRPPGGGIPPGGPGGIPPGAPGGIPPSGQGGVGPVPPPGDFAPDDSGIAAPPSAP